jgi:DNA-binding MarR family transcriptional regulator
MSGAVVRPTGPGKSPADGRLTDLADELERAARALRASSEEKVAGSGVRSMAVGTRLPFASTAEALLAERRRRDAQFEAGFGLALAGEPGWDMLLLLYVEEAYGRRVSVSALCTGAGGSPTTAARHLRGLEDHGLMKRTDDPLDRRRSWIAFTPGGLTAMRLYLESASG